MTTKASPKRIYRVIFLNQGKVYELFARHVSQGEMYGFIQMEDLIFEDKSSMLVDPSEERLRNEFADVRCIYVPIHSVIRIDEVEKEGPSKIRTAGEDDNVATLPLSIYPPKGKK